MDENFILQTETAQKLYHEHAKKMPIIDYHCHLPPHEIAEDKNFKTLTNIWLDGDHYKWRAMRANGVDEKYCTGDAPEFDKFMKWADTVPCTLRNPLYHWTHLELKAYFGIDKVLNPNTAKEIYNECTEKLNTPEFSTRNLMRKMKVEVVCTTDDPIDSLEHHKKVKDDGFEIKVLPTWRADKAMAVESPEAFNDYIDKLSEVTSLEVNSYEKMLEALRKRHDFFAEMGCKLSDHGIENFYAEDFSGSEIEGIFNKIRLGHYLTMDEILKFKSAVLHELAIMDFEKDWTQQFHIGAIRNNNSRMFLALGPDKGYDSIIDLEVARPMSNFFDKLESESKLGKTIVYNLNPRDNELFITMIYNFNDGSVPGKMQFGSGWWFLDQKDGMQKQMNSLSVLGLLSRFVGMLTDSRSFLSYPRHEYFRRVLCDLLGTDMENGEIPNDMKLVGNMVENICYNNAKEFFRF